MKRVIGLLIAALAAGLGAFAALPSVGILNQASSALSKTSPDLSTGLKDMASRDSASAQRASQGMPSVGSVDQQKKDLDILNKSADKLDPTRPDLSKGLRNYADEKSKVMKAREVQGVNKYKGHYAP